MDKENFKAEVRQFIRKCYADTKKKSMEKFENDAPYFIIVDLLKQKLEDTDPIVGEEDLRLHSNTETLRRPLDKIYTLLHDLLFYNLRLNRSLEAGTISGNDWSLRPFKTVELVFRGDGKGMQLRPVSVNDIYSWYLTASRYLEDVTEEFGSLHALRLQRGLKVI